MIDYLKYDDIQTEEIIYEVNHYYGNTYEDDLKRTIKQRQSNVNSTISELLSKGYEIIDVRYDNILAVKDNNDILMHTVIIYDKLKDTVKK